MDNTAGDAVGTGVVLIQGKPSGSYVIPAAGGAAETVSQLNSVGGLTLTAAQLPIINNGLLAGQGTTGTRFKIVFANMDANTTYYASTAPVSSYSTPTTFGTNAVTAAIGTAGDATQSAGWATLLAGGVTGTAIAEVGAYALPAGAGLVCANGATAGGGGCTSSGVPIAQINRSTTGTGQISYEVTNVVPGTPQTLTFALFAVYNNGVTPPSATTTVTAGYAPTSSGTAPLNTTNIPRFTAIP